jgi:hypothetical protein
LVHMRLEKDHDVFLTFAQATVRIMKDDTLWPGHNNFHRVLLEYACGTGEMKNFQQLHCHKDGNPSHLVETMTVFGRVPINATAKANAIVKKMQPALLVLPNQQLVIKMIAGIDVLHCKLVKTHHAADYSRNTSNYSWVHGP